MRIDDRYHIPRLGMAEGDCQSYVNGDVDGVPVCYYGQQTAPPPPPRPRPEPRRAPSAVELVFLNTGQPVHRGMLARLLAWRGWRSEL